MIGFDTNILIYTIEQNTDFSSKAEAVFLDIEQVGGICSTLVITESIKGNIRALQQLAPLHSRSISVVPLSSYIAEKAGQLRLDYGLKPADAIHIATAICSKADIFVTNDRQLLSKKIPEIKIHGL